MQQPAQRDGQPVAACKSSWIVHAEEPIHTFPRTIEACNTPPIANCVLRAEPRKSSATVNRDNSIAMIANTLPPEQAALKSAYSQTQRAAQGLAFVASP